MHLFQIEQLFDLSIISRVKSRRYDVLFRTYLRASTVSKSASGASNVRSDSEHVSVFTSELGSHTIGLASNQSRTSFVSTVPWSASQHDFSLYNVSCRHCCLHIASRIPLNLSTFDCRGSRGSLERAEDSEQMTASRYEVSAETRRESIASSQRMSRCCSGNSEQYSQQLRERAVISRDCFS